MGVKKGDYTLKARNRASYFDKVSEGFKGT
jgi:hypothetical protein